jgi:hypothetical protein
MQTPSLRILLSLNDFWRNHAAVFAAQNDAHRAAIKRSISGGGVRTPTGGKNCSVTTTIFSIA